MADFVTEIEKLAAKAFSEHLAEKGIHCPNETLEQASKTLGGLICYYYAGTPGFVRSPEFHTRHEKYEQVKRMFNGKNATEIARILGIGRATVYRILKRPG